MRTLILVGIVVAGLLVLWGESVKQDIYADHVLRRAESDPEFRERLRAALGVPSDANY